MSGTTPHIDLSPVRYPARRCEDGAERAQPRRPRLLVRPPHPDGRCPARRWLRWPGWPRLRCPSGSTYPPYEMGRRRRSPHVPLVPGVPRAGLVIARSSAALYFRAEPRMVRCCRSVSHALFTPARQLEWQVAQRRGSAGGSTPARISLCLTQVSGSSHAALNTGCFIPMRRFSRRRLRSCRSPRRTPADRVIAHHLPLHPASRAARATLAWAPMPSAQCRALAWPTLPFHRARRVREERSLGRLPDRAGRAASTRRRTSPASTQRARPDSVVSPDTLTREAPESPPESPGPSWRRADGRSRASPTPAH